MPTGADVQDGQARYCYVDLNEFIIDTVGSASRKTR